MPFTQASSPSDAKFANQVHDIGLQPDQELENKDFDHSKRSQWLRKAVLRAIDGLVSTASLMMGVGAVKQDVKMMILTGLAWLVAGGCSMAIGEFVSVYSQLDMEVAQRRRNRRRAAWGDRDEVGEGKEGEKEGLPNHMKAAAASAFAFLMGAVVPLLAASFVKDYSVRVGVVVAAVSLALVVSVWLGAVLRRAPMVGSAVRVLLGGWLAMAVTFGLTKWIDTTGLLR